MDVLASLHLDELPEQQTRTSHLEHALADDPNIRLGFNACCHCAAKSVSVECRACHRVKYCSRECCKKDASFVFGDDEESSALGHSSVICALLRTCGADEDAEESPCGSIDQAASERVQSEHESYPATLSNILLDGPCYQKVLSAAGRRENKDLVIQIVGASQEAELWNRSPQKEQVQEVWDAYAEALTELAERKRLSKIRLCFVGPDCPEKNLHEKRTVSISGDENRKSDNATYRFIAETRNGNYNLGILQDSAKDAFPKADVVVFFNPGFTCPDYDWDATLSSIPRGTPFLVTTNTEMEGVAECQHLYEKGHIPGLAPVVAEIVDSGMEDPDGFFGENPFIGSRVRQSGTLANDVYVKNRWLYGGIFATPQASGSGSQNLTAKETTKVVASSKNSNGVSKKRKRSKSGNTKKKNPALI